MIEQQARVTRVTGEHTWITIGPVSGCKLCDQGRGCGAGLFVRLLRRKPSTLRMPMTPGLQPGAVVTVAIPESSFMRWVMRLYGWPLTAALGAGVLAQYFAASIGLDTANGDLLVLVCAALVFWLVTRLLSLPTTHSDSSISIRLLADKPVTVGVQPACGAGKPPYN